MARGPKFSIKVSGVDEILKVINALGSKAAAELENNLDKIVEANAVKIANEAKVNAPIKDGFLKRSIRLYGRPARLARTIGSNVPYAQRQEYEHKTHKAYFRKALWNGRATFREDIRKELEKLDK